MVRHGFGAKSHLMASGIPPTHAQLPVCGFFGIYVLRERLSSFPHHVVETWLEGACVQADIPNIEALADKRSEVVLPRR